MMTSESQKLDRVRRRIVGLRALARNNSNENEAQAAATMADKLADEYNLDLPQESTTRETQGFNEATARATAEWHAGAMSKMMADLMDAFKNCVRRGSQSTVDFGRSTVDFGRAARNMADIFGASIPSPVPPKRPPKITITEHPTTDDTRKFVWKCPSCGGVAHLTFSNEAIAEHRRLFGEDLMREVFETMARKPGSWRCIGCAAGTMKVKPSNRRDPDECLWPDDGDDS